MYCIYILCARLSSFHWMITLSARTVSDMTELLAHVLDQSLTDPSVRPQDDFYGHVNGTWLATHNISADRPIDGAFYTLRDLSEERGRAIVEDALAGRIDDPDAHKIAIMYRQFMDEDSIEEQGASPITPLLEAVAATTSHDELATLSGQLMRGGISTFFVPYVNTDTDDTSRYMLYFQQAGLGLLDESFYREDQYEPIRQAYCSRIERLFTLAHIGDAEGDAASCAQRVMDWETRLAAHHWDSVTNRDPHKTTNHRTTSELIDDNPGFDWRSWAQQVGLQLESIANVNVNQPDYLATAASMWASEDLRTLKLWQSRKIISAHASLLSHEFVEANFDFYSRTLAGTEELRQRWKRGLGLVEGTLGDALGRLYIQRHFPADYKEQMEALVQRLLEAYRTSISTLSWMSEETRTKALAKLDTFNPKIAYPDTWRDYSGLDLDENASLVDNVRKADAYELDYEWAKLSRPVDRDEWFMTPQTVNAYYNPSLNEIVFPAAILQPPFFDPDADAAVNFGAIGAVIGHEIGHGFDDQGSRYDADGALRNWWTDEDRNEFESRTHHLIEQYEALVPRQLEAAPAEVHVNGALTIGENIGDLGGLAIAWRAWCASLRDQGIDRPHDAPVIDGLTGPQRFFYSWARIWRSKSRDEFAQQMLVIDPHSPAEFRCNQVLRNFPEFATTFDVTESDGMWLDPSQRVEIWS